MKSHGGKGTKLYEVWSAMRQRCYCKTNRSYKYYGARGIGICPEWASFANFRAWAFENGYKEKLTLDRIDNNGNYEPDNCRWVTMKEQINNRRTTKMVTYNGQTMTVYAWAERLNIQYDTLYQRLYVLKWSVERAFGELVSFNKHHRNFVKEIKNEAA